MFLSKRGDYYYLYYPNPSTGKRNKISTGSTTKREAYQFLRKFNAEQKVKKNKFPVYQISEFKNEFLEYSSTIGYL